MWGNLIVARDKSGKMWSVTASTVLDTKYARIIPLESVEELSCLSIDYWEYIWVLQWEGINMHFVLYCSCCKARYFVNIHLKCRGEKSGNLIMTVEWSLWVRLTQLSPSVLWYCWSGLLTCKNRLPYNLYCIGGDVKHCAIQSLLNCWAAFMQSTPRRSQFHYMFVVVDLCCYFLTIFGDFSAVCEIFFSNSLLPSSIVNTCLALLLGPAAEKLTLSGSSD